MDFITKATCKNSDIKLIIDNNGISRLNGKHIKKNYTIKIYDLLPENSLQNIEFKGTY